MLINQQNFTEESIINNNHSVVDELLFVGYTICVPVICIFGIVGNLINFVVLLQPEFKNKSPYVYLRALSVTDFTTVLLEMLNGITQGITDNKIFDTYIHLPIGCVSTTMSICTLTAYTVERFIYVNATFLARRYCKASVARTIICALLLFSVCFNMPYFFAFYIDDDGEMRYATFAETSYYAIHNWVRLGILGLVPAGVLASVNVSLMVTLHRALQRRRVLLPRLHLHEQYRLHEQAKVNICLTSVILLFLLGELPTNVISRTSAPYVLYGGDEDRLETAQYRLLRMVSTIFMCVYYSVNFFLYCSLDRAFGKVFRRIFCRICDNITVVKTIAL